MTNNTSSGGISLTVALGLIFIVLKLVGSLKWSWFWVLSPFWGVWGLLAVFGILYFLLLR